VSRTTQTYLLTLNRLQFEALTRTIMLESNKLHKLQGIGQCLARWMKQWDDGHSCAKEPELPPTSRLDRYKLYVGLNPESTKLLKALRDHLAREANRPITVAATITRLIAFILNDQLPENACTTA
jgi:hypothetical protein